MSIPRVRIYVQEDHVPGAIAVIDLAQELEQEWPAFVEHVRAHALEHLPERPKIERAEWNLDQDRAVASFLCRLIAERIKWTAQSVLSADPACSSINDVITAAADRARGDTLADIRTVLVAFSSEIQQCRTPSDVADLAPARVRALLERYGFAPAT